MAYKQIVKICPISGLEIIENDRWQNLRLAENYLISFRKIGDHIVDVHGYGNMGEFDAIKFQNYLDRFVIEMEIQTPFVEMRNYEDLTGILPTKETLQIQKDYAIDNKDRRIGFVTYNATRAIDLLLKSAQRQYKKVNVKVFAAKDYEEAVTQSISILSSPEKIGYVYDDKKNYKILASDLEWVTLYSGQFLWEEDSLFDIEDIRIDSKHPLHGIVENLTIIKEELSNLRADIRQKEKSLVEERHQTEKIIESLQSGIIITEVGTQIIVDVNQTACEMIDRSKEELIGLNLKDIIEVEENYNLISSHGGLLECRLIRKDGVKIPVKRSVIKIRLRGIPYLLENILDLSDEKTHEEKLQKTLAHTKQLNNLTFNREKRIIDMKMEVNSLLKELKRPPKYKSVLNQQRDSDEEQ
ncbi:MAG: PAS domain S-box protein [Clostridia bacterium]|nr:PAS domain S-box protein [Clostridia bacterium]